MSFAVEATSPFEDQGFRLVPTTTAIDDEVLATVHGPALVLCLSFGPGGVAGGGCRPVCGDFGGGVLAVS